MKNKTSIICITLFIILFVGSIAYFCFSHDSKKGFWGEQFGDNSRQRLQGPGNVSLSEEDKYSTVNFFNSTSSIEEINNYCENNRMNCMYYCREINPQNEVCKKLFELNKTDGEMNPPKDRNMQ